MKNKCITTILLILSLTLSACVSSLLEPDIDPTQFYVLREVSVENKGSASLNMNISPISLPAYMNKQQITSLKKGNMLNVSEINRWGEPLNDSVIRIVYLDMMNNLSEDSKIYAYPIAVFDNSFPSLKISIYELLGEIGKETKIKATWILGDSKTDKTLACGSFEKSISNGKGYADYADSISQLISDLSVEIVGKVLDYEKSKETK